MKITWVNHASFVLESGSIRLLTDPWLEGTAFNDSWELLTPSKFETPDFAQISHIWFSHEHPDHFAPPVLKKIPQEVRERIVVLFQETRDRRVMDFCGRLGFKLRELRDGETTNLTDDFRCTCGKVPFYDSWLACEAEGKRLLNLNDCVLESPFALKRLRSRFGPIDVLLSQFSYASWYGNADEPERWTKAASLVMSNFLRAIAQTQPRFVIPCASFIRFCHEENEHMNTFANTIGDVVVNVSSQGVSTPIVLFPGDSWNVGEPHDNSFALARYEAVRSESPRVHTSVAVPVDEIDRLADAYRRRMLANNNASLVKIAAKTRLLPEVIFHLSDCDINLAFDWTHGLRQVGPECEPDITLHSDSLAYLFRFDWGMDTLQVGGRFRTSKSGFRKLMRTFALGSLNNIGRRFGPSLVLDPSFVRRAIEKIIRAR